MPSLFIFYLFVQYNTPSYYQKTFENKLAWKNLAAKKWLISPFFEVCLEKLFDSHL